MRKIIEYLLCVLTGLIIGLNFFNRYDVNRDLKINASDYIAVKTYIMEREE